MVGLLWIFEFYDECFLGNIQLSKVGGKKKIVFMFNSSLNIIILLGVFYSNYC